MIGPVRIQVWGLFVALGVVLAVWLATREAKKRGLDWKKFSDVAFWIIVWSFIGARLGHVVFYEWAYYSQHLVDIVKVWHGGFSSYGGFIGGTVSGFILLKKYASNLLSYADCVALGLSGGWTIGRIGCFFIHDHPGTFTDFALAVQNADGEGARHDLGLYDGILTGVIFVILLAVNKRVIARSDAGATRQSYAGILMVILMVGYGFVRFFLDFLRATDLPQSDIRIYSLTPAQYLSIGLVVWGMWLGRRILRKH